ncbi:MAG: hypothetical protein ACRDWA_18045 [Acidimicrobiia bacterium]
MLLQPTEETAKGSADEKPIRRLIVAWQDPSTRSYHRVGHLDVFAGPRFRFRYDTDAVANLADFKPFTNFPEEPYDYESPDLFPFFNNRVMSQKRPEYSSHLRALALGEDASPIELLERSGGERATDTIQVFPLPTADESGVVRFIFPAHGVRHVDGAAERIEHLSPGDSLQFREDATNDYNPHALLVSSGEPLGWVPDFLVPAVRRLTTEYGEYRITVEAANGPEVPFHFRLLCRLEVDNASDWDPDTF